MSTVEVSVVDADTDDRVYIRDHGSIPSTYNHPMQRWSVETEADLASIVPTAEDIYKVAIDAEGTIHTLVRVEPPLWLAATGPEGLPGWRGFIGATGSPGSMGPIGPQGEMGLEGFPGAKGEEGYPGYDGLKGFTGDRGPKGEPGDLVVVIAEDGKGKPGAIWSKNDAVDDVGLSWNQSNVSTHTNLLKAGGCSQVNASGFNEPHVLKSNGEFTQINASGAESEKGYSDMSTDATTQYMQMNVCSIRWRSDTTEYDEEPTKRTTTIKAVYSQINGLANHAAANAAIDSLDISFCQLNPVSRLTGIYVDTSLTIQTDHAQIMTGVIGSNSQINITEPYSSYWISSGNGLWGAEYCACPDIDDFFYSNEPNWWLGIKLEL